MGRPREHDDATGRALLAAAEEIVESDGLDALTVRGVASRIGTTTRAVYSLFGSRDGLVAALGAHAFGLLGADVEAVPTTSDPVADLVDAGLVFRRFARGHPSLFHIAVQRTAVAGEVAAHFRSAAQDAFARLEGRVERLQERALLGGRSVHDAACQFHALCEGLAALELRGVFIAERDAERQWRQAVAALINGFASAPTAER